MKSEFQVDFAGVSHPAFYIDRKDKADAAIRRMLESREILAADCETAALPQYRHIPEAALSPHLARPRLFQFFTGKGCVVIDLYKTGELPLLGRLFEERPSVFHNKSFDAKFLIKWLGIKKFNVECTAIMARCCLQALYPGFKSASLKEVAKWIFKEDVIKKGGASDWSVPELTFEQIYYAAKDAVIERKIYDKLSEWIDKLGLRKVYNLYSKAQDVICHMELAGVSFDIDNHKKNIAKWREKLADSREEVQRITGIGVITDTKIGDWLKANLKEEVIAVWPRTEKSPDKLSVGADALVNFSHLEVVKPFSEFQKMKKLCTSFGIEMLKHLNSETGKIHCSYIVAGAATGRLSCRNINIQQCPRDADFRKTIIPSPGYKFVVADYGSVEVRCVAELAKEEKLLEAYERGFDIYKFTAAHLNSKPIEQVTKAERQGAKACFSGDTEVLTPEGWVRLDQYTGQVVMQYELPAGVEYNKSTGTKGRFNFNTAIPAFDGTGGELSFAIPIGAIKRKGTLTHYRDRRTSINLTDDHNIIYVTRYNEVVKAPVSDTNLKGIRHFINSGYLKRDVKASEMFTRFLAAVIADGSFVNSTIIRFGFSKRRKKRRLVEYLLKHLKEHTTYTVSSHKPKVDKLVTSYRVTLSAELSAFISLYIEEGKKLAWRSLREIDPHIFLEEAQYWDGHRAVKNKIIMFSTVVQQTIEVMQAMAHTSGYLFNYSITPRKGTHSTLYSAIYSLGAHQCLSRPHLKKITTTKNTDVYCLEVPSGALLIRHNNKISIQGNCVLGLLYGLGFKKFSHYAKKNHGVDISEDKAFTEVQKFRELYPTLREWQLAQVNNCIANRYTAFTTLGKSRKLTEENYFGASLNLPVQGSCAEIMLLALVYIHKALGTKGRLVMCVHDEVVVEAKEEHCEEVQKILVEQMTLAYSKILPSGRTLNKLVEPGVGNNWYEAKE